MRGYNYIPKKDETVSMWRGMAPVSERWSRFGQQQLGRRRHLSRAAGPHAQPLLWRLATPRAPADLPVQVQTAFILGEEDVLPQTAAEVC